MQNVRLDDERKSVEQALTHILKMQFAQNNPCNALESFLDREGIFSGDLNRSTLSHRFRSVIRKGQYPREWPRKILTLINEIYEQKKWQVQRLRQWQEFPYCVFYITTGFFSLYFALIKLQWRSTLQYSVFFLEIWDKTLPFQKRQWPLWLYWHLSLLYIRSINMISWY